MSPLLGDSVFGPLHEGDSHEDQVYSDCWSIITLSSTVQGSHLRCATVLTLHFFHLLAIQLGNMITVPYPGLRRSAMNHALSFTREYTDFPHTFEADLATIFAQLGFAP